MLYDSIIACFGSRFTVNLMPEARRYRVFPLGTFHYFDWQKHDTVGISIGTCPQVVSSETANIGLRVGDQTRILPFAEGETFATMQQTITPLMTVITASDPALPVEATFTFRMAFYPQSFEQSCVPAYALDISITNTSGDVQTVTSFFGLPLHNPEATSDGFRVVQPIHFPDGIDHAGINGLTFEQIITGDDVTVDTSVTVPMLRGQLELQPGETQTARFYHAGYIAQPALNQQGRFLKFGYTTLWDDAQSALDWWRKNDNDMQRKTALFESTVMDATFAQELKLLLSASFKGIAANAWWAEDDWFSVMEIGAYHSTLDVDYQLALFFFQYWPELIGRMLNQWAGYYHPGSGYMAHDVGQHLEATGNRYGGPGSAMKVEENCNYLALMHHYWRTTGDESVLNDKHTLISELVAFLLAADTSGSGLPNHYADNTNDWGSGLITASEEQSYFGVRLVGAYLAAAQMAAFYQDADLAQRCRDAIERIQATMRQNWANDHYPISFADEASYHHYSMWTTHGLLYPLRNGLLIPLDLAKLRIDLINSTRHTMREHGCVHSTVDVRGWQTQNLWRDCIAAYLGLDFTDHLHRYLGHGEYVSYEDTTILEVANELMVVPGAVAEHKYAGETHDFPMVDGHPRPTCGFGLPYALAGIQFDALEKRLSVRPVSYPLRIALTTWADWENERVPWMTARRSIPNQDGGPQPTTLTYTLENEDLLTGWDVRLLQAYPGRNWII